MKKIFSIVLALAMIFSLSINAFAANNSYSTDYKFTDSKGKEIYSVAAGESTRIYLRDRDDDKLVSMKNVKIYRGEGLATLSQSSSYSFSLSVNNLATKGDIIAIAFEYRDYDKKEWVYDIKEIQVGNYYNGGSFTGSLDDVNYSVDDYGDLAEFDPAYRDDIYIGFDRDRIIYKASTSPSRYKFNLEYNRYDNYGISDKYPRIYCDFFNVVNKPTFAQTGTLYFDTDLKYVYSVDEHGKLSSIPARREEHNNRSYLAIRTSKLGNYVISEKPLVGSSGIASGYVDYDVDIEGSDAYFDPRGNEEVLIGFYDNSITYNATITPNRYRFNLSYNTTDKYGIALKNRNAYCEFFNVSAKPTFGKMGTLTFYTNLRYIYSIDSDGNLTKLTPEIDTYNKTLSINTSYLGSYVLSDKPLRNVSNQSSSSSSSQNKPSTPSTPTQQGSTTKLNVAASNISSANREGKYAIVKLDGDKVYTSGSDLASAGKALTYGEKLILRRVDNKRVIYQWYIDAKNASKAASRLELGMTVNDKAVKAKFEKWFSNKVSVVTFNHKGNMGINPSVAVKLDLTGLDKNNLTAYLYNPATNTYKQMTNANIYVDSAGYTHFNINEGGSVIITNGKLR